MKARPRRSPGAAIAACCLFALITLAAVAQHFPSANPSATVSRFELYGEYSYLHPLQADIYNNFQPPILIGGIAGVNYFFSKHYGVEGEGGFHSQGAAGTYDCMYTGQLGPVARYQVRRFVPFAHVLGGAAKIAGPAAQPCTWGWGLTGGLGVDYVVPGLGGHLALRPIQADFEYNHIDYGPIVLPVTTNGGILKENAYRLSAGVVIRLGDMSGIEPTSMSCDATPSDIFAGEPITVGTRVLDLRSHRATYVWSTSGGRITGTGDTVHVDTGGLAPGTYVVTGHITKGARGSFGECNARFEVHARTPPTISCIASPATIAPGGTAAISATASSSDNRQLTYSYTASSGNISGAGPSATFTPQGMVGGSTATVNCNVVDDKGLSAMATTTVQLTQPIVPPAVQTRTLCTLTFDRDRARPARVDNEAKGCLDDIALSMQSQADSTLDMAGSHDPAENPAVAAQRAVNAKLYLTREKGVDAGRIRVHGGAVEGRAVLTTLVPAGAADLENDPILDEANIHTDYQPYAMPGASGGGNYGYTAPRRTVRGRRVTQRRRAATRQPVTRRRPTTRRRATTRRRTTRRPSN